MNVPDDLKEEYETCCQYQNRDVILCKQLIERIAKLEAENARLSAPVTDAEWETLHPRTIAGSELHMQVNALLQSRKGASA